MVSMMYSMLSPFIDKGDLPFFAKWEHDLHINFTMKHGDRIPHFIYKTSISTKYQELG